MVNPQRTTKKIGTPYALRFCWVIEYEAEGQYLGRYLEGSI